MAIEQIGTVVRRPGPGGGGQGRSETATFAPLPTQDAAPTGRGALAGLSRPALASPEGLLVLMQEAGGSAAAGTGPAGQAERASLAYDQAARSVPPTRR